MNDIKLNIEKWLLLFLFFAYVLLSILCQDSIPRPLDLKSSPLTTLPLLLALIVDDRKMAKWE